MKKILIFSILLMLILTGCMNVKDNKEALDFKEDYESINGEVNKYGKEHRTVSIDENNPFITITTEELLEMIEDGQTFYVYFGDKLCPWCRSIIEKAIEIANKNNIEKIYYIPIWDDEGNEIVRDKYELKDGDLVKTVEGCDEYDKFLEYFDSVLSDYNITDSDGNKISTGEKRIYAPNFIYVKNGEAKKLVTGISESQTDSRQELSEDILKDEEDIFEEFFK